MRRITACWISSSPTIWTTGVTPVAASDRRALVLRGSCKGAIFPRIRQVIVPQLNDTAENVQALNALIAPSRVLRASSCCPFHKLCTEKYDRLGLPFPFARYPPQRGSA